MKAQSNLPIIAKANCGIPQWHGTHIHYSGTPELMADYAALAGRCRRSDRGAVVAARRRPHVAAMRRSLDGHERGPAPNLDDVTGKAWRLRGPAFHGRNRCYPAAEPPPPLTSRNIESRTGFLVPSR